MEFNSTRLTVISVTILVLAAMAAFEGVIMGKVDRANNSLLWAILIYVSNFCGDRDKH